eukprot:gene25428-biopygen13519
MPGKLWRMVRQSSLVLWFPGLRSRKGYTTGILLPYALYLSALEQYSGASTPVFPKGERTGTAFSPRVRGRNGNVAATLDAGAFPLSAGWPRDNGPCAQVVAGDGGARQCSHHSAVLGGGPWWILQLVATCALAERAARCCKLQKCSNSKTVADLAGPSWLLEKMLHLAASCCNLLQLAASCSFPLNWKMQQVPQQVEKNNETRRCRKMQYLNKQEDAGRCRKMQEDAATGKQELAASCRNL